MTTVKQEDGNTIEIPYDSLILAIGSYPVSLSSIPFDGDRIISSNEALNLRKIPESILIAEGTLAIKNGCSVKDLAATVHTHPTFSEVIQETSFKAMNRSLHA